MPSRSTTLEGSESEGVNVVQVEGAMYVLLVMKLVLHRADDL